MTRSAERGGLHSSYCQFSEFRSPIVKKGRHRRFEEARAMKRSSDIDFDSLLESLKSESGDPDSYDDDDLEDDDDR